MKTFLIATIALTLGYKAFSSKPRPPHLLQVKTSRPSPTPYTLGALIKDWSKARNLNHALLVSLILSESTFDSKARSKVGARGLMQVMPFWANTKTCPRITKPKDLDDPNKNLDCGTAILKRLIDKHGEKKALIAFNAGELCLKTENCPSESILYAEKIQKSKLSLQNQVKKYG